MFVTCHVLKSVRNILIKHNFLQPGKDEISWKYIIDFYVHDKKYPVRVSPKLTDLHIYPNNFGNTQVLSHTVASDLKQYMS